MAALEGSIPMMRLLAERGAPIDIDLHELSEESLRAVIDLARSVGRTDVAERATELLMSSPRT